MGSAEEAGGGPGDGSRSTGHRYQVGQVEDLPSPVQMPEHVYAVRQLQERAS